MRAATRPPGAVEPLLVLLLLFAILLAMEFLIIVDVSMNLSWNVCDVEDLLRSGRRAEAGFFRAEER